MFKRSPKRQKSKVQRLLGLDEFRHHQRSGYRLDVVSAGLVSQGPFWKSSLPWVPAAIISRRIAKFGTSSNPNSEGPDNNPDGFIQSCYQSNIESVEHLGTNGLNPDDSKRIASGQVLRHIRTCKCKIWSNLAVVGGYLLSANSCSLFGVTVVGIVYAALYALFVPPH